MCVGVGADVCYLMLDIFLCEYQDQPVAHLVCKDVNSLLPLNHPFLGPSNLI